MVEDKQLKVVIDDGLEYLKKEAKNEKCYQSILFDVDNKDSTVGMGCPPKQFLDTEVLENVKALIGNEGLFVLNLVCRDEELRNTVICDLKKSFNTIYSYKLDEELNEILYCQNSATLKINLIEKSAHQLQAISTKCNLKNDLEIEELMKTLKIC